MSLCIPALILEPIIQKFNQSFYSRNREVPPEQTRTILDVLSAVSFPVAAELHGTVASMEDLISLAPGDVLRLDHSVDQPVEISVGGLVKFYGELAAHGGRTAARVTAIRQK
jgi:flagellar motor switch protein FliM